MEMRIEAVRLFEPERQSQSGNARRTRQWGEAGAIGLKTPFVCVRLSGSGFIQNSISQNQPPFLACLPTIIGRHKWDTFYQNGPRPFGSGCWPLEASQTTLCIQPHNNMMVFQAPDPFNTSRYL